MPQISVPAHPSRRQAVSNRCFPVRGTPAEMNSAGKLRFLRVVSTEARVFCVVSASIATQNRRMSSVVPIADASREAIGAFLDRLSLPTIRSRYLRAMRFAGPTRENEIRRLQSNDAAAVHTVLLVLDGQEVHGIGEYIVEGTDRAEIGLVVEDAFQNRGVGRLLFRQLEQHARRHGIRAFTGEVANDNTRALHLLRSVGHPLRIQPGYASAHFELALGETG